MGLSVQTYNNNAVHPVSSKAPRVISGGSGHQHLSTKSIFFPPEVAARRQKGPKLD